MIFINYMLTLAELFYTICDLPDIDEFLEEKKAHFQGTLAEQAPFKNEVDHFLGMHLLSMGCEGKPTGPSFLILKLGKMNCFPSWVTY